MKKWIVAGAWILSILLGVVLGCLLQWFHWSVPAPQLLVFLRALGGVVKIAAWPVVIVVAIMYLRPHLITLILKMQSLKIGIVEVQVRPPAQPQLSGETGKIEIRQSQKRFDLRFGDDATIPLPFDYFYLRHVSYYRPHRQGDKQFQPHAREKGYIVPVFDFRVWLDSYYSDALELVDRVEYFLGEMWPYPVVSSYSTSSHFELHQLTWGEILILAKIYFKLSERKPLVLHRWINIPSGQWESYHQRFNELGVAGHSLIYQMAVGAIPPLDRWEEQYLKWPT